MSRLYIAPERKCKIHIEGKIIEIKALSLQNRIVDTKQNICGNCALEKYKICFEYKAMPKTKTQASFVKIIHLDTRPACFGNDPDNLSKKPMYYVLAEKKSANQYSKK